jgi:hypothetical protein
LSARNALKGHTPNLAGTLVALKFELPPKGRTFQVEKEKRVFEIISGPIPKDVHIVRFLIAPFPWKDYQVLAMPLFDGDLWEHTPMDSIHKVLSVGIQMVWI